MVRAPVDHEHLALADVRQLRRLALYLGVPLPKARPIEDNYRQALANAILRYLKRGGRRRLPR
jgi:hypothetical protein